MMFMKVIQSIPEANAALGRPFRLHDRLVFLYSFDVGAVVQSFHREATTPTMASPFAADIVATMPNIQLAFVYKDSCD